MFSTIHKTDFKFSVTFNSSSANAFDLDKPEILSFGNELSSRQTLSYPSALQTLREKGEIASDGYFLLFRSMHDGIRSKRPTVKKSHFWLKRPHFHFKLL